MAPRESRTSDPVNLQRMQWLMQRCTASRAPITDAQVIALGERPEGPIMPVSHLVVRSLRLPEDWGRNQDGSPYLTVCGQDDAVYQVAANSRGEPWLLTMSEEHHILQSLDINAAEARSLRSLKIPKGHEGWDREPGKRPMAWIKGFTKDGEPVTFERQEQFRGLNNSSYEGSVYVGEHRRYHHPTPREHDEQLDCVQVLHDGTIARVTSSLESPGKIFLDDAQIGEHAQNRDQTGNRINVIVYSHGYLLEAHNFYVSVRRLGGEAWSHLYISRASADSWGAGELHPVELVDTRDGPRLLAYKEHASVHACRFQTEEGETSPSLVPIHRLCNHPKQYLRGYTELAQARFCFVSETPRDGFEQWAVGETYQENDSKYDRTSFNYGPAFDCVSELFARGDTLCYWAVADRYLHLVMIPDVPTNDL